MEIKLNLKKYSRKSLSDFLQIATQVENEGWQLPYEVVQVVRQAHDDKLNQLGASQRKKDTAGEKVCKTHGRKLFRLECGKMICWDCYGNNN